MDGLVVFSHFLLNTFPGLGYDVTTLSKDSMSVRLLLSTPIKVQNKYKEVRS